MVYVQKNSVLCLSRLLCARLLSNRQNVSKLINFYLNKSLLIWKHSGTFKGRFVFSTRCKKQRKEGFNIFQKFLTNQKQIKKFTLAKLKLFKQRYLVFTTFSRLRRANLTLSFFNYLASLYSSFLSENLRFLPLFHGGVKKAFSVSITFGVINKFRLLNPQFLARFIAKRLSYGIPLRRVLKPIVADLSKSIANVSQMLVGFRIKCSGRFNRAQMASVTIQRGGSLSLSSVGSLVNMGFSTAFLRYGACGIKVWVSSREWAGFSSVILNRKFSVLKILNNVVVSFLKRGKRLLKPYLYVYLMSFFLLNFFHLEKRTVCEPEVSSGSLCNSTLASGVLDLVGKDQFLNSCDLSYFILFGFLKLFRGLRWRRKKYFFLSKGIVKKKLKVKKFRGWKTKHQNLRKVTQQKSVSLKGVKAKKKYVKYLFTSFSSIKKK